MVQANLCDGGASDGLRVLATAWGREEGWDVKVDFRFGAIARPSFDLI